MQEPKTLLVVDDSQVSRMMLKVIINTSHPGWQILEASSAGEALEVAQNHSVDLVTLDMNMPGEDGLTVAPKLLACLPSSRIALLTANIQERVQKRAEALGLTFISKPITEEKILAFIDEG